MPMNSEASVPAPLRATRTVALLGWAEVWAGLAAAEVDAGAAADAEVGAAADGPAGGAAVWPEPQPARKTPVRSRGPSDWAPRKWNARARPVRVQPIP